MRRRRSCSLEGPTGLLLVLACLLMAPAYAQETENTERGWMGLYIRDLDAQDLRALGLPIQQEGVVVSGVDDDGPASQVGIEPGDVITSIDGKPLGSRLDFLALLGDRRAGDRIRMQIVRRRSSRSLEFRLAARPREMQGSTDSTPDRQAATSMRGLEKVPHLTCLELENRDLAHYFGVSGGDGVLVLDAHGDAVQEFRAGDVITSVNDAPIRTVLDLQQIWLSTRNAAEMSVRIVRKRRSRHLLLTTEMASRVRIAAALPDAVPSAEPAWTQLRHEIIELRQRLQELEAEVDAQVRR